MLQSRWFLIPEHRAVIWLVRFRSNRYIATIWLDQASSRHGHQSVVQIFRSFKRLPSVVWFVIVMHLDSPCAVRRLVEVNVGLEELGFLILNNF